MSEKNQTVKKENSFQKLWNGFSQEHPKLAKWIYQIFTSLYSAWV